MKKEMDLMDTGGAGLGLRSCGTGPRKGDQPAGPQCQSCGRVLVRPDLFGSEGRGILNTNYCRNCYEQGTFTEPDLTMEQMIERATEKLIAQKKLAPDVARLKAEKVIPMLRRWRAEVVEAEVVEEK